MCVYRHITHDSMVYEISFQLEAIPATVHLHLGHH